MLRFHSILSNRPKSNLEAPPSISFKFRFGIDLSLLNKLSKDHINFSRLTTKTLINAHFRQLHILNAIPKISKLPATNLNSRSSELITMILFENAFHMGLCLRGKLWLQVNQPMALANTAFSISICILATMHKLRIDYSIIFIITNATIAMAMALALASHQHAHNFNIGLNQMHIWKRRGGDKRYFRSQSTLLHLM